MTLKTTHIYLSLFLACFSVITMSAQNGQPHDADASFTSPFRNTFEENGIFSINVLPDNKIIAGGFFNIGNNNYYSCLVRLNQDGSLDRDLIVSPAGSVNDVILLPDGRMVIGGIFNLGSTNQSYCLARLNNDGSIDATFAPVTGIGAAIFSMALQSDGKIVAGGSFDTLNGVDIVNLARFNTDGSVDTTFNLAEGNDNTGFNGYVNAVAVLPDGKILAGGGFDSFSGISANRIARLTADGSFDTTFNIGTGADDEIWSLYIKPDGKVLIGGGFTTFNGTAASGLGCLNANGTLDTTFNPGGSGAAGAVYAIDVDEQGRILIGGAFTSYNSQLRSNFARINSDGTLDDNFNRYLPDVSYPNGFSAGLRSIALQPDGKILIGGLFNTYKNTTNPNITRLMGGDFLGTGTFTKNTVTYYPNPVSDKLYIHSADAVTTVQVVSLTGQVVQQVAAASGLDAIDMSVLQAGCYFVNAVTTSGTVNFKIVKK
jgi:uncharacterized delta-60 repeat protein